MSTYQKTVIMGYLGADPVTKTFEDGGSITSFSVATSENWKDKGTGEKKERTDWHNIVSRGKTGEIIAKYFKKGSRILVEGKLRTRSWESDGHTKYITEIVIFNFSFVDSSAQATDNKQPSETSSPEQEGPENSEDDLPF